jgi:hypothetical protein
VLIWNWRCAMPILSHLSNPNHTNHITHSEKWCQQCKHNKYPCLCITPHRLITVYITTSIPYTPTMPLISEGYRFW